jgi:hypothetical protein
MKISIKWLEEINACYDGISWFKKQFKKQKAAEIEGLDVVEKLIDEKRLPWANWLIVRLMTRKQKVQYAVFAAEQVINLFEKKYPDDKRPRKAIEAAKTWISDPSEENRRAADAAADAYAAYAAYADADAYAAYAAYAAATADATYAAYAATAAAAAYAAAAADAMRVKILEHGIKLLR